MIHTANSTVALALLVAGIYLIYAEFLRPGWVIPGTLGAVVALAGLAALLSQPRDGRALLLLALVYPLLAIGAWTSVRLFTVLAGAAMFAGSMLLAIQPLIAAVLTIPLIIATSFLLRIAVRARANKLLRPIS